MVAEPVARYDVESVVVALVALFVNVLVRLVAVLKVTTKEIRITEQKI